MAMMAVALLMTMMVMVMVMNKVAATPMTIMDDKYEEFWHKFVYFFAVGLYWCVVIHCGPYLVHIGALCR